MDNGKDLEALFEQGYYATLEEIAKELGVTRNRAGQICELAYKSFRRELFKRCIDKEDLI